jgi:hypothetical protein
MGEFPSQCPVVMGKLQLTRVLLLIFRWPACSLHFLIDIHTLIYCRLDTDISRSPLRQERHVLLFIIVWCSHGKLKLRKTYEFLKF